MSEGLGRAALVVVGDELLAGAHGDANSPHIARELAELGIRVARVCIVPDDEEAIAAALDELWPRFPLLLLTGGLGPTLDDVTRHGVARALGRGLVESAEALALIEAWFAARQLAMPRSNRRQALFPEGAQVVPNRAGTAPAFRVELGERVLFSLPGPPREMRAVLGEEVVPWLRERIGAARPLPEHSLHLFGLSESDFAERVGAWMARDADPLVGCSAKQGVLSIHLRARSSQAASRERLAERVASFRERFSESLFSESEARLERVLGRELIEAGVTISTAESCTGGLVSSLLTSVPGISAVFRQGFVTYADAAKRATLGVPADLLERHGAVSEEVAEAMALGASRAAGARLALAVSGVAGPGGGSAEKPVGLVCFASALDGRTRRLTRRFPPRERDWIRALAARTALHLGLRHLREASSAAAD